MKKKVIAAGHICLDITPVFKSKKVNSLNEVLTPGKLLHVGEAQVSTGGSVANTGLAMKLLGADVSLMGMVGRDEFGEMICNILKRYDAEKGMLVKAGEATSYTVVVAPPGIDRIFLHNPGTNNHFHASDIPQEALEETALFHFGYPPIMRSMYQNDGEELVQMMKRAQEAGAATSLDMASVDPDSEGGRADWKKILQRVLPYVDFFVPSAEELCYMLDRSRLEEWQRRAGGRDVTEVLDPDSDIRPLAQQCMELGAKVVLIKCGAPGMYYCTAPRSVLQQISGRIELDPDKWEMREGFETSFIPEQILSGTGAGDTSIAAFLTAVLEGYPLEEAVRFAVAEGACCVAAYDALGGLKPLDELKQKMDAGWAKNKETR